MQRLIEFGNTAEVSPEFGVDERAVVRLWLVRDDNTSTPGAYAYADVEIKASQGAQWTLFATLTGDRPWLDIVGVDDETRYRVVRPEAYPYIAVDRSSDSGASTTLRAPANLQQRYFDAQTPVIFKARAAAEGDFIGLHYDYQLDDANAFGEIIGTLPYLQPGATNSYIKFYRDTDLDTMVIEFFDSAGNIDWSAYEGGQVGIATECNSNGMMTSTSWNITLADIAANGLAKTVPGFGTDLTLVDWLADGKTFFVFLMKPGQEYPTFNLGPKTGTFTVDRKQAPARLTAGPFAGDENLKLSFMEGNAELPWMRGGTQVQLDADDNGIELPPGDYRWTRSCNSTPGVYLSTGWR